MKFYVLKDRQAVPATQEEWLKQLVTSNRIVAVSDLADGTVIVSTVFLGLDYNWSGEGPPLLYETMVFGGSMAGEMERTSTWEEAEQTHERVCREVRQRVLQ